MKKIKKFDDKLTERLIKESDYRVLNEYELYYLVEAAKEYERQVAKEVKRLLKESEYRVLNEHEILFLLNESPLAVAPTIAGQYPGLRTTLQGVGHQIRNWWNGGRWTGGNGMMLDPTRTVQAGAQGIPNTPMQRIGARVNQGVQDAKQVAGQVGDALGTAWDKTGQAIGTVVNGAQAVGRGARAVGRGVRGVWNSAPGRFVRGAVGGAVRGVGALAGEAKAKYDDMVEKIHADAAERNRLARQTGAPLIDPNPSVMSSGYLPQNPMNLAYSEGEDLSEFGLGALAALGIPALMGYAGRHKLSQTAGDIWDAGVGHAKNWINKKMGWDDESKYIAKKSKVLGTTYDDKDDALYDILNGREPDAHQLKSIQKFMQQSPKNLSPDDRALRTIFTRLGYGTMNQDAELIRQGKTAQLNRGRQDINLNRKRAQLDITRMQTDIDSEPSRKTSLDNMYAAQSSQNQHAKAAHDFYAKRYGKDGLYDAIDAANKPVKQQSGDNINNLKSQITNIDASITNYQQLASGLRNNIGSINSQLAQHSTASQNDTNARLAKKRDFQTQLNNTMREINRLTAEKERLNNRIISMYHGAYNPDNLTNRRSVPDRGIPQITGRNSTGMSVTNNSRRRKKRRRNPRNRRNNNRGGGRGV